MPPFSVDTYAVMGSPIQHSLSPKIHQVFAEQSGQCFDYFTIEVTPAEFPSALMNFIDKGGKGLNLTAPLKEIALTHVHHCSERAKLAGAVNTLIIDDNKMITGDNTDGVGFLRDVAHKNIDINHQAILIIGSGGAARGLLAALATAKAKPHAIILQYRTEEKALTLKKLFSTLPILTSAEWSEPVDLVINAATLGAKGEIPTIAPAVFGKNTIAYDLNYAARAEPFLQFVAKCGVKNKFDGYGMLVEQAAEAFYQWRGVRPRY